MSTTTVDTPAGPVAVVVIGMAGSGKTTFMQRIVSHLYSKSETTPAPYVMNLDPAVVHVPFESNVDIRDSVNYKEVMKQYNLGPNGGILTSLNLFSTKIDQVIGLIEKRFGISPDQVAAAAAADTASQSASPAGDASSANADKPAGQTFAVAPAASSTDPTLPQHLLIDTPGQIEVFTWSASSSILLSALSTSLPTVVAYVIDTPRTAASTATFMANMLYAVSVLYRTGLPMILVLNKSDVRDESSLLPIPDEKDSAAAATPAKNRYDDDGDLVARCVRWMRDWESLCEAINTEAGLGLDGADGGLSGSNYQTSLTNSMSLVLDEFYNALEVVGVSAMSGAGVDDFFSAVEKKRVEFLAEYWPNIVRQRQDADKEKLARREKEMGRLLRDLSLDDQARAAKSEAGPDGPPVDEPETVSDVEALGDNDEDDSDDDYTGPMFASKAAASIDDDDTLQTRYERALKQSHEGDGDDVSSNMSFARYVMKQGMAPRP